MDLITTRKIVMQMSQVLIRNEGCSKALALRAAWWMVKHPREAAAILGEV